jgi:hypothetical protein
MSSHPYVQGIYSPGTDRLIAHISNSSTRKDVRDQVCQPSSSPLLGPSIPIDDNPEDSMLTKNYAHGQTQKNLIERDRCTSFTPHLTEQLPTSAM